MRKHSPQGQIDKKTDSRNRDPKREHTKRAYVAAKLHPQDSVDCRGYLPMTCQEMDGLGWERPDFVLVSGDAYVDHPSFGTAIIGRVLEAEGFKVAVLPQPNWQDAADFKRFGRPRLAFLVNSGVIDSMVNHYTAAKKPRSEDAYAPGNRAGQRPDRAVIVYTNCIREAYRNMPVILGGLEASLRRFAHYDYWSDKVRRSILADSGANLLVYGMGERAIVEIAQSLDAGVPVETIDYVRGTAYLKATDEEIGPWLDENNRERPNRVLPDFQTVAQDKKAYASTYALQKRQTDSVSSGRLLQVHGRETVCVNPPAFPLEEWELDRVYALPYRREAHPLYVEHIPALDEVEFSVTSCRGCFGDCSFCALTYHQGRSVHSRSHASILAEVTAMTVHPRFKGYVHDVGGPTANFRQSACAKQAAGESCSHRSCLAPQPCPHLKADHSDYLALLRKLRQVPGVKKVFIRSGLRYDYMLLDRSPNGKAFFKELIEHHISGQLKIAPEHIDPAVLRYMGKPGVEVYERFRQKYAAANARHGKEQYLVPYFISSHPGSDLRAAIELAQYMRKEGIRPEQVQDFYPTPGTRSTAMFFSHYDPEDMGPIFVPKNPREKRWQRALLQSFRRENAPIVREALREADREDLIGYGREALVVPEGRPMPRNESWRKKESSSVQKAKGMKKAPGKQSRNKKRSKPGQHS